MIIIITITGGGSSGGDSLGPSQSLDNQIARGDGLRLSGRPCDGVFERIEAVERHSS
jgi:hypothetical protein